jgi:hypothetical protein
MVQIQTSAMICVHVRIYKIRILCIYIKTFSEGINVWYMPIFCLKGGKEKRSCNQA